MKYFFSNQDINMILVLRGHIRNAFDNLQLYEFIHQLSKKYKIQIYIHTWSIQQNNISWREIKNNFTKITYETILSYFQDLTCYIQKIMIEDDEKILLIGKKEGKILSTKTSLLGWKRYIYGQYRIIDFIYQSSLFKKTDFIFNTRFDLFCNSYVFPKDEIIEFIEKYNQMKIEKNYFMREGEYCGLDNIMIGNVNSQYHLIHYLHYQLDEMLENLENQKLVHPEFLVYRANQLL